MPRVIESERKIIAPDVLNNCHGYLVRAPQSRFELCFTDSVYSCCGFEDPSDMNQILAALEEINVFSPRPLLPSTVIFSSSDSIKPSTGFQSHFGDPTALIYFEGDHAYLRIVDGTAVEEVRDYLLRMWSYAFLSSTEFHEHLMRLLANFLKLDATGTGFLLLHEDIVTALVNILKGDTPLPRDPSNTRAILTGMMAICMLKTAATRGELVEEQIAPYLKPAERMLDTKADRLPLKESAVAHNDTALRLLAYLGSPADWVDVAINLRGLDLSNEFLNWQQLEFLRHLTQLEELNLSGTAIGVSDRPAIESLSKLRSLNISSTHSTNNTVLQITALRALEELDLSETYVNDASIESLQALPMLKRVNLAGSRVRQTEEQLQEQLPNCNVAI